MMPALYLDRICPRRIRYKKRRMYLGLFLLTGGALAVSLIFSHISFNEKIIKLLGAAASFSAASYIWKSMLEAMHVSFYAKSQAEQKDYWTLYAKQYGIFKLPFAQEAFLRLGIAKKDIPHGKELTAQGDDFATCIAGIFTDNQDMRAFLEERHITKTHWTGVWTWLEKRERDRRESVFILDHAHLSHLPAIGDAFSYGQTFTLSKFGHEMKGYSLPESLEHFYARTFSLLKQALAKSEGANVVLISQSVDDAEEYVRAFMPHMIAKKFIRLDTEALIAINDSSEFEATFTRLLSESARAGNIVLVIPHIASIMHAAHAIGFDPMLVLGEYMKSPELHIIMLAERHEFHATLAANMAIIKGAEKIELDAIAPELLQSVAESEVIKVENKYDILFSYQAISFVVASTIRYGENNLHDTLRDYLDEIALFARKRGKKNRYITEHLVQEYIAEKTGTKGTFADNTNISASINVQEILKQRIKGQDAAVSAVASTLERIRAGLGSAKKPLGTFLFLGPTGVGKTETAKALAQAYFGNEDKMIRFDMSEFSDTAALIRLIGSFETGEVGLLVSKVRDAVHGVLLFDEIEKAHEKVRDLMLQILDEGFFSDARGEKINMKNFIIICTSNAGSAEIYSAFESHLPIDKQVLIDHIIEQGIFRPEFLNRFDELVVYHPLSDRQLASIVSLKLTAYSNELYEKKVIRLNITPSLIDFVMNNIENKAFGGREIQRVIQRNIESTIAKDLLTGRAQAGSTVSFNYNSHEKNLETVYT